ncbi:hypothetical protein BIFCAT_00378 [Bifidobacterium catenulatum DSM 16992 = JCM 1194 = LMG 11043]|nr:hypothetical protein BIFCAT_00378 [Bifidobacterium catenulatum DSM 16992 = JCM 1194 = LMG 11043]
MVVIIGKLDGDIGVFNYEGSSPRMRGTPSGVVGFVYKAGIIPAYAGNTAKES